MSHVASCMTAMKNPAKSFGHVVTGIDDSWEVLHDDIPSVSPFLNGIMLDFDVSGMWSGTGFIDHSQSSLVVNEECGRTRSNGVEFLENYYSYWIRLFFTCYVTLSEL